MPGESLTYYFIAEHAGVFKYHCEGVNVADMDRHSLSGMNGIVIIDPIDGYRKLMTTHTVVKNGQVTEERKFFSPKALEFALVFNELYLDSKGQFDQKAEFNQHPTQTTINGMAFGYTPSATHNEAVTGDPNKNLFVAQPWNSPDLKQFQGQVLSVPTNEHIRFFLENNGNESIFFHVVGEQLDRVVAGNRVQEANTQTFMLGGSDDATVDIVFDKPGVYVPVNHDYAELFQGQAAVIVAGDPFGLNQKMGTNAKSYAEILGNPSDAVPPMGKDSIKQPKLALHCLCTDERAQELAKNLGITQ
jgi:nitrite reductase (NO-forming)